MRGMGKEKEKAKKKGDRDGAQQRKEGVVWVSGVKSCWWFYSLTRSYMALSSPAWLLVPYCWTGQYWEELES